MKNLTKNQKQFISITTDARHNKFCAESKDAKVGGEE